MLTARLAPHDGRRGRLEPLRRAAIQAHPSDGAPYSGSAFKLVGCHGLLAVKWIANLTNPTT